MTLGRVAFAHYDMPSDVGGVSTWIRALLPDLKSRGFDVHAHIMNFADGCGPNADYLAAAGISVRTAKRPERFEHGIRQCLKWINEDKPDVYVPNSLLPAHYAGAIGRDYGLKTIGVLHSDDAYFSAVFDEFIAGQPRWRFCSVVAVSEFLHRKTEALQLPGLIAHRIPCGVPIPRTTTSFNRQRFTLVYLGRLVEEQKQISQVARAFCEAARRNPTLEAVIAGDGPARASVEQIIAANSSDRRVRFLGRLERNEVEKVLSNAQAFVLLSDYEGLPVSLLEAMATGVVPICRAMRSGIGEVIEHDVNGLVVRDSGEDFQNSVSRLLSDSQLWRRCSTKARATVEGRFSMEACHRQWADALTEVMANSGTTRFPIASPARWAKPHPKFGWREPASFDRCIRLVRGIKRRLGLVRNPA